MIIGAGYDPKATDTDASSLVDESASTWTKGRANIMEVPAYILQQTKVEIYPKCNGKKLVAQVFYDLPSICVYCNGTGKLSTIC
jgi:hypothetical protein